MENEEMSKADLIAMLVSIRYHDMQRRRRGSF